MYVLLLPLKHNSICCRRRSKVSKTKTLVNREGIPSFCTNEHKVFIRLLLPIYKSISHKYIYMCCKSAKQT